MTSGYRIERTNGAKDSIEQIAVLRKKWPLAFPARKQDVRPLAKNAVRDIADAMGWSHPYTVGVLGGWKLAAVYCQAVLNFDQRIALDGTPAEAVEPEAKETAAKRLEKLAELEDATRTIQKIMAKVGLLQEHSRTTNSHAVADLIGELGHLADEFGIDFLDEVKRGVGHWHAKHLVRDGDVPGPDAIVEIAVLPRHSTLHDSSF